MQLDLFRFTSVVLLGLNTSMWGQSNVTVGPPSSPIDRIVSTAEPRQGAWTQEEIKTMEFLRDQALQDPFAYQSLRHLTDVIGPRLSGSSQAAVAVEWVASQMRALGADVTLEETTVPHWVRGEETAVLTNWAGEVPGTTQKVYITALGGSVATDPKGITAEVLVVRSFAELAALRTQTVKGKIVLFDVPFDQAMTAQGQGLEAYLQTAPYRVVGPSVASRLGAAAVLIRSIGSSDMRTPHTGALMYQEGVRKIPAAAISVEDAELIARLARGGPVTMHVTLTPQNLPATKSYNVIADLKGSQHPEQIVIVSGHLDSWDLGTGAVDDGAGVVTAMETLQLLQKFQIHPRRTIRFVAWMNEEFGGGGAKTYSLEHEGDFKSTVAAMESDLGCDHPTGLYLSDASFKTFLAPVGEVLRAIGSGAILPIDELPSEDLAPMIAAGVPSLAPIQDLRTYFNYHHTAADTLDKVDVEHLRENAAVVAVAAFALAETNDPLPRNKSLVP